MSSLGCWATSEDSRKSFLFSMCFVLNQIKAQGPRSKVQLFGILQHKIKVVVPLCYTREITFSGGVLKMSSWVSQTEERNCLVFWWNSSGYFCTGSFARWQQGEQNCSSVAGVGVVFKILWAPCRHLT